MEPLLIGIAIVAAIAAFVFYSQAQAAEAKYKDLAAGPVKPTTTSSAQLAKVNIGGAVDLEKVRDDLLKDKEAAVKARNEAESDARAKKATLEQRTAELADTKAKLNDAKKRLHEEKEVKRKEEVDRARAQIEREAQGSIDAARAESAELALELSRLKAELEASRSAAKRRTEPPKPAEPAPVAAAPAVTEAPKPAAPTEPPKPRELFEVEKTHLVMMEEQAIKRAEKYKQLEDELKKQKDKTASANKLLKTAQGEAELRRSGLIALEKRLNKANLELDKLRAVAFKAGLGEQMVLAAKEAESEMAARERSAARAADRASQAVTLKPTKADAVPKVETPTPAKVTDPAAPPVAAPAEAAKPAEPAPAAPVAESKPEPKPEASPAPEAKA